MVSKKKKIGRLNVVESNNILVNELELVFKRKIIVLYYEIPSIRRFLDEFKMLYETEHVLGSLKISFLKGYLICRVPYNMDCLYVLNILLAKDSIKKQKY